MKHPAKMPYGHPLSLASRPAIERLDSAVDKSLELQNQEAKRWRRFELFGVGCEAQLVGSRQT